MRIRLANVLKTYGDVTALDVHELEILSGESYGLVGNNGAGKTTFLRLLLDLIEADRGKVYLDDHCVAETDAWKPATASYLDEGFLIDFLRPLEYFELVTSFYERELNDDMLASYENFLDPRAFDQSTYIRALSQGNRKKIGLVAALLVVSDLLILDEPFANLDPTSQHQLKTYLRRVHESGTTLVISSHNLNHITDVCDRITLLERGQIVLDTERQAGTLEELEDYFEKQVS